MSKLEFYARPLVAFDPANKKHRAYFYEFQTKMSWGACPVRFICPDQTGMDLVSFIQRQMLEFYTKKEFGAHSESASTVVRNGKKIAQKTKKLVDKTSK